MKRVNYDKICKWMYRNARPLDLARWQYHFEGGSKENVLKALSAYQNEDGGFGHALEADSWNEFSAPIQTWNATEILREIEFEERDHPLIQGILKYLKGAKENGFWPAEIPTNNDYPHAPWWSYDKETMMEWGYNPTAALLGFVLYFGDKKDAWYEESCMHSKHMMEAFLNKDTMEMHEISCFIQYLYYAEKNRVENKDLAAFIMHLKKLVHGAINKNINEWGNYTCTPSRFIHHPSSIFYVENQELTDYECEYIMNSRNDMGIWDIVWDWGHYPKEFAISQNWWKASVTIENLLFLKNFNHL